MREPTILPLAVGPSVLNPTLLKGFDVKHSIVAVLSVVWLMLVSCGAAAEKKRSAEDESTAKLYQTIDRPGDQVPGPATGGRRGDQSATRHRADGPGHAWTVAERPNRLRSAGGQGLEVSRRVRAGERRHPHARRTHPGLRNLHRHDVLQGGQPRRAVRQDSQRRRRLHSQRADRRDEGQAEVRRVVRRHRLRRQVAARPVEHRLSWSTR